MVPPARLEHAACGLGIRRSIHLSYGGTNRNSEDTDIPLNEELKVIKKIIASQ